MRMSRLLSIALLLGYGQGVNADWAPCGGNEGMLWAWASVGENLENVDDLYVFSSTEGRYGLGTLLDRSGNGHHYFNKNETPQKKPRVQYGLSRTPSSGGWSYSTSLAPFMRNNWEQPSGNTEGQNLDSDHTFVAAGSFYLAFAGLHTRESGNRDMWAYDPSNFVVFRQDSGRVRFVLNGNNYDTHGAGTIPFGPVLMEFWRDGSNVLHAWINGVPVGTTNMHGTFRSKGWGWKRSGSSGWDDYAFEIVTCGGLPSAQQRAEVREYFRDKWKLYEDGDPKEPEEEMPPPKSPTDLQVE